MRRIRTWLGVGATAAALALGAAGCGGSSPPAPADPATVAPAGSALYVDATVRPEGSTKDSLDTALSKLLGTKNVGSYVTARVDTMLAKDHISYTKDVQPWLGEKAAVFYQAFGSSPKGAVILQTTDPGAALDTFAKGVTAGGTKPRSTSYKGVDVEVAGDNSYAAIGSLAVAGPEQGVKAAIDTEQGSSLADSGDYKSSIAPAPSDRIFTAWADPNRIINDLVSSGKVTSAQEAQIHSQLGQYLKQPAAAWGDVTNDHFGIDVSLAAGGSKAAGSSLISGFPDDSWVAFGEHDYGQAFEKGLKQIESAPDSQFNGSQALARIREALGVDVGNVGNWLGDVSGYISGTSIVDLSGALVATTRDEAASAKSLDQLEGLFKKDVDVITRPLGNGQTGFTVTPAGSPVQFVFTQENGKVIAGLGQDSVDAVTSPSKTLGDTPTYKAAASALSGLTPSFFVDFKPIATLLNIPGVSTNPNLELAKPYFDRLDYLAGGSGTRNGRKIAGIVLGVKSGASDSGSVASAGAPAYAAVNP